MDFYSQAIIFDFVITWAMDARYCA